MPAGVDSYTKLLLHFNGENNSTTFRDASPYHKTATRYGDAKIVTDQSKFGGASGRFDGSGDYLSFPDSDDWYFGTGDFTLDAWVRWNVLPGGSQGSMVFAQNVSDLNYWTFGVWNNGGTDYRLRFVLFENNVPTLIASNWAWTTMATGQWYHIAQVRQGNYFRLFLNGTMVQETTKTNNIPNFSAVLWVARMAQGGHYFNGWIDEARISKGIARWWDDFTPPQEAYWIEADTITDALTTHDESSGDFTDTEVDSYVKLLLHGEGADASTTIKDSSPSHKTVTAKGNAQIDTAQKVLGSASILFDGTGDYVSLDDSDDWYFSGDFTIDFRIRFASLPSASQYMHIMGQLESASKRWYIYIYNNAGTYRLHYTAGDNSNTIAFNRSFSSLAVNTWYHLAVTRAGSSFKLFVNGAQMSTEYTSSLFIDNISAQLWLGGVSGQTYLNGWLDEVRLIKGKAIWTASFTVPTAAYAILDHRIEHVTTSEDLVTDPGLPTDADFTDGFTTDDYLTLIAGLIYEGDIDEDILAGDTFTPNQVHTQALVGGTAQMSTTVVSGSAVYNKSITDALTTAETIDAQFNITMHGAATFPLFETAAYTGLGFNSGDMNFPVFKGIAYAGARSSIQEIPKFGLSGTMQIQYPFGQAAKHPKFNGVAAMTVGKVANGDADFPLFSGTGTMIGNPQVTGDVNFPVFGGNGGMSVGGRFANYVLRYVR